MPLNIPNLLSLFRIAAAPFLLLTGWFEKPILFFILFGMMLLSDALDGIIARMMNQTSVKGEMDYIIAAIIIYVLPAVFALFKFGKLASYHTWVTKISAVLMSVGVVVLLGFENNFLFHMAIYFLVIEMVENIAITFILPDQKTDIHFLKDL